MLHAGCAANTAILQWSPSPGSGESPAAAARLLADVAKTRVVTAFGDGTFEFAHRSVQVGIARATCPSPPPCLRPLVITTPGLRRPPPSPAAHQEYFASCAILALGLASALEASAKSAAAAPAKEADSDSDDDSSDDGYGRPVTAQSAPVQDRAPDPPYMLVKRALLARGNDSLRRFVAAGLSRQDDVDALVGLLWLDPVKDIFDSKRRRAYGQKPPSPEDAFSAAALASLAECVRECRPALIRRVPCVDTFIAPRADTVWEAVSMPGASAVSFSLGGSRAIPAEFWVVVDACVCGEKTRRPAVAAIDAYLAAVAAEPAPAVAVASGPPPPPRASAALVCRTTVSVEVLRASGDRSAPAMATLRRLRDELRAAGSLRLAAIIALSILDSSAHGDEAEALLDLASGANSALSAPGQAVAASVPLDVRCGAIIELGLRHADDAAVRDALLELLLPQTGTGAEPDDDGAAPPPPFDVVRSVVRALGVAALPPDSLTEVLLHPDAPQPWARAVAHAAFEFWLSTQQDISSAAESEAQARKRESTGGVKVRLTVDESWNLWHLCAALGLTVVLEELSAREEAAEAAALAAGGAGGAGGSPASLSSVATCKGMMMLHCALATRQWDLVRLFLLQQSEAEGAGYPGLARLHVRATATAATARGQLPLAYALHLEAPADITLALIDATPVSLILGGAAAAATPATPATPADGGGGGRRGSSDEREREEDSMIALALDNNKTAVEVVVRLLSLYPPAVITAELPTGDTLLEAALRSGAPGPVVAAVIQAARSEWASILSNDSEKALR